MESTTENIRTSCRSTSKREAHHWKECGKKASRVSAEKRQSGRYTAIHMGTSGNDIRFLSLTPFFTLISERKKRFRLTDLLIE